MNNPINLMVIDDSETNTILIKSIFEETGKFNVTALLDSTKAVAKIEELKPDIVLLDLMMPKKDGFMVLEDLQYSETLKDIPVVAVSALDKEDDIERALNLGAAGYVVKPIGKNQLLEKVEKLLSKK